MITFMKSQDKKTVLNVFIIAKLVLIIMNVLLVMVSIRDLKVEIVGVILTIEM